MHKLENGFLCCIRKSCIRNCEFEDFPKGAFASWSEHGAFAIAVHFVHGNGGVGVLASVLMV